MSNIATDAVIDAMRDEIEEVTKGTVIKVSNYVNGIRPYYRDYLYYVTDIMSIADEKVYSGLRISKKGVIDARGNNGFGTPKFICSQSWFDKYSDTYQVVEQPNS